MTGTLRTPFAVATTRGKSAPSTMRKIGAGSPMPNQMTASGIHAIGLIGRSSWISGFTTRPNAANQPTSSPSGMPTATAIP